MLVLSRERGQRIFITIPDGRQIVVSIEDIVNGYKARVGVDADKDIVIHREEVMVRIEYEGRQKGIEKRDAS